MERGQYAKNIRAQIEKHGDNIVGVYVNSPHNPTGTRLSKQEFDQIFAGLNEYNSGEHLKRRQGRKIGLIMDNPYPHAAPEVVRSENQKGLDTGLDSFRQDQVTPWIMPVSGSKFFGTAEPGFTMIAVHSTYAKLLAARLIRSVGIGFFSPFFRALTAVLQAENDDTVLNHFARLREKYIANRAALEKVLGKSVVDGDAGMTALVKISSDDYLGRTMTTHDGLAFPINDLNDVIEYLANKHGVIAVNNGIDESGLALLRLAAAEEPANYEQGVNRLAAALNELRMTPSRQPKRAATSAV
jgi:aspartate/methionine/tyrosine aminotransferase